VRACFASGAAIASAWVGKRDSQQPIGRFGWEAVISLIAESGCKTARSRFTSGVPLEGWSWVPRAIVYESVSDHARRIGVFIAVAIRSATVP